MQRPSAVGEVCGQSLFQYSDDPVHSHAERLFAVLARLGFRSVFYIAKNYDGRTSYASRHATVAHDGLSRACRFGARHGIRIYAILMALPEGYVGKFGSGGMSSFLGAHPDLGVVDRRGISVTSSPVRSDSGMDVLYQGYHTTVAFWNATPHPGRLNRLATRLILRWFKRINREVDWPNRWLSPYLVSLSRYPRLGG